MYLLYYVLPQLARLSRALQAERIDLTAITPLVDTTLNTLVNITLPMINWVLELMDEKDEIEKATNIEITTENITTFQEQVAKPFITVLKANISSRFVSQDIVSPHLASLIQRKCQQLTLQTWLLMGTTQWI